MRWQLSTDKAITEQTLQTLMCLAMAIICLYLEATRINGDAISTPHTNAQYRVIRINVAEPLVVTFRSLNDSDQIVGEKFYDYKTGLYHAVIWHDGKTTSLADGNAISSSAYRISNSGVIVGYLVKKTGSGNQHACVWRGCKSVATDLEGSSAFSIASFVNNRGDIVGWAGSTDQSDPNQDLGIGVQWTKGKMHRLTPLKQFQGSRCIAINDIGTIAGDGLDDRGKRVFFELKNGYLRILKLRPGYVADQVADIDEKDEVIGGCVRSSTPKRGEYRSLLWRKGESFDLDTSLGSNSHMNAINRSGLAVGSSDSPRGPRATLWENGKLFDLNNNINKSGWVLTEAVDINNNGHILCHGTFYGREGYCLLVPR